MNYFFIAPRERLLSSIPFSQALLSRWPQAHIKEVLDPADTHALEFKIPMTHSQVHGSLNRRGDAVIFVGDIRDCAEVALWCRTLIPEDEPTTVYDESMSGCLEVGASTTLADIIQALSN